MRGSILTFDAATGSGLIRAEDGQRYTFSAADWRDPATRPYPGIWVDFETISHAAREIVVLPQPGYVVPPLNPAAEPQNNGNLLGGLSIGAAFFGLIPGFGVIFLIAAFILGIVARRQAKSTKNSIGATLGAIGIGIAVAVFAIELVLWLVIGAAVIGSIR